MSKAEGKRFHTVFDYLDSRYVPPTIGTYVINLGYWYKRRYVHKIMDQNQIAEHSLLLLSPNLLRRLQSYLTIIY
jgi:hypothetical protein